MSFVTELIAYVLPVAILSAELVSDISSVPPILNLYVAGDVDVVSKSTEASVCAPPVYVDVIFKRWPAAEPKEMVGFASFVALYTVT